MRRDTKQLREKEKQIEISLILRLSFILFLLVFSSLCDLKFNLAPICTFFCANPLQQTTNKQIFVRFICLKIVQNVSIFHFILLQFTQIQKSQLFTLQFFKPTTHNSNQAPCNQTKTTQQALKSTFSLSLSL